MPDKYTGQPLIDESCMKKYSSLVKRRLDSINDYTTGINLIRGSRDFRVGTDKVTSLMCRDGFYIQGNPLPTFTKDEDGFAVMKATSSSQVAWSSNIAGLKKNDEITVSVAFMLDDVNNIAAVHAVGTFVIRDVSWSTTRFSKNITLEDVGIPISEIKPNTWYIAKSHILINQDIQESDVAVASTTSNAVCYTNGISHKQLMVQRGFINNPIWAPNPDDLVYGLVNDETTGINLLRGTRDFADVDQSGITLAVTGSSRFYQGFHVSPGITKELDSEGFTVAVFSSASNPSVRTYGHIGAIKAGESITYGFEILYDSDMTTTGTIRDFAGICDGSQESAPSIVTANHAFADYGASLDKRNVWQKVKVTIVSPSDNENAIFAFNPQFSITAGSIRIRKIYAYKGIIEHPIWSASPFDVAQKNELKALEDSAPKLLGTISSDHAIAASASLDSYLTPGSYYCGQSAVVNTVTNRPESAANAFVLDVAYGTGMNDWSVIQHYKNYIGDEYERAYYGTSASNKTWHDWRPIKVNGVAPIEGGGTNANTLEGAKSNLGITALENKVAALEAGGGSGASGVHFASFLISVNASNSDGFPDKYIHRAGISARYFTNNLPTGTIPKGKWGCTVSARTHVDGETKAGTFKTVVPLTADLLEIPSDIDLVIPEDEFTNFISIGVMNITGSSIGSFKIYGTLFWSD